MLMPNNRGLTLLEILIALFIFAIVSLMLSQTLHTIITAEERVKKSAAQLRELQMAMLIFSRDLAQETTAFSGTAHQLHLTRSTYHNGAGKFIRDKRVLIQEIEQLLFRYLDDNNSFHSSWPPDKKSVNLPRAVEISIYLPQGGILQQLYLLPRQKVLHVTA